MSDQPAQPEIKPCLYCGGKMLSDPDLATEASREGQVYWTVCTNRPCRAWGPNGKSEADAIAAHNAAWERMHGVYLDVTVMLAQMVDGKPDTWWPLRGHNFDMTINTYPENDDLECIECLRELDYSDAPKNAITATVRLTHFYYFSGQFGEFGRCELAPHWEYDADIIEYQTEVTP